MVVYFADSSVQEAEAHRGNLFVETERTNAKGKLVKSKHPVYLNVRYSTNELMSVGDWLATGQFSQAVRAISFQHPFPFPSSLPGEPVREVTEDNAEGAGGAGGNSNKPGTAYFLHVPLEDFTTDILDSTPEQVTILLTLPNDQSVDLRELESLCSISPRIRILGGKLLGISGLRIGYFPPGTLKGTAERHKNFVYPNDFGTYDNFQVVSFSALEGVQETQVKEKKPRALRMPNQKTLKDLTKAPKEPKAPKPKKISQSNLKSSFLSTTEVVDF